MGEEVVQLREEEFHGPKLFGTFLFGQVGGESASQLVVHDHGNVVRGIEVLDGADAVVRNAGATV